jgi:hypothetical protein
MRQFTNHTGGKAFYADGDWDGLHDCIRHDWAWLKTRMNVEREFLRQRLADIDGYVPCEERRRRRDECGGIP